VVWLVARSAYAVSELTRMIAAASTTILLFVAINFDIFDITMSAAVFYLCDLSQEFVGRRGAEKIHLRIVEHQGTLQPTNSKQGRY